MSDKQEKRKIWVKSQENAIHCVYECEKKEKEIMVEDWVFGMPFHYTVKNENIIGEKAPDERIKELEAENASLRARLDKAVELPFIPNDYHVEVWLAEKKQSVMDESVNIVIPVYVYVKCENNEAAEKRLAELIGGKK